MVSVMTIKGRYERDDNFTTVYADNRIYTIARGTGDWGSIGAGETTAMGQILTQPAYNAGEEECSQVGTFELEGETAPDDVVVSNKLIQAAVKWADDASDWEKQTEGYFTADAHIGSELRLTQVWGGTADIEWEWDDVVKAWTARWAFPLPDGVPEEVEDCDLLVKFVLKNFTDKAVEPPCSPEGEELDFPVVVTGAELI